MTDEKSIYFLHFYSDITVQPQPTICPLNPDRLPNIPNTGRRDSFIDLLTAAALVARRDSKGREEIDFE